MDSYDKPPYNHDIPNALMLSPNALHTLHKVLKASYAKIFSSLYDHDNLDRQKQKPNLVT